jgi:glutathione S-transferase
MLKLWGRITSINVQKVRWALAEMGVAHERIEAGMQFGVVNEGYYRAMNPNGRVPTIDDEGFVLWESNAIVRYLAARHGAGSLWPTSLTVRADADRWMDWATTTLQPAVTPVFWNLIRTAPENRNMKLVAEQTAAANEAFQIIDRLLADRPWVAGDQMTMGDIPLGTFVHRWLRLPVERPAMPHLQAYFDRLQQREAYRETVMIPLS